MLDDPIGFGFFLGQEGRLVLIQLHVVVLVPADARGGSAEKLGHHDIHNLGWKASGIFDEDPEEFLHAELDILGDGLARWGLGAGYAIEDGREQVKQQVFVPVDVEKQNNTLDLGERA